MRQNTDFDWPAIILDNADPARAWDGIFSALLQIAENTASPQVLHNATVEPDRLLAEAAWELWQAYPEASRKTTRELQSWQQGNGSAVLIIDALSLRELPYILAAAKERQIELANVKITGAECPSTTDKFAAGLGIPSRASLASDKKPKDLPLFANDCHTDVLKMPFEDCEIKPAPNIFLWHTWLDDLIHVQKSAPDVVNRQAAREFQSDGFWNFIAKMRQGRKLVITSDHGYAVSRQFSSELTNPAHVKTLAGAFGASRHKPSDGALEPMTPPVALEHDGHYVVMGQRKWKVSGGFPQVCHGGLSLLEVAVPWLEFDPL